MRVDGHTGGMAETYTVTGRGPTPEAAEDAALERLPELVGEGNSYDVLERGTREVAPPASERSLAEPGHWEATIVVQTTS